MEWWEIDLDNWFGLLGRNLDNLSGMGFWVGCGNGSAMGNTVNTNTCFFVKYPPHMAIYQRSIHPI